MFAVLLLVLLLLLLLIFIVFTAFDLFALSFVVEAIAEVAPKWGLCCSNGMTRGGKGSLLLLGLNCVTELSFNWL